MRLKKVESNKVKTLKGKASHGEVSVSRLSRLWVMPEDLDESGEYFWRKYGSILLKHGLLTEVDRPQFEMLVRLYSQIQRLGRILDEEGLVVTSSRNDIKRHPAFLSQMKAISEFRSLAQEFGLSPSSRNRLGLNIPDKVDETEAFLFGGKR